MSQIASDISRVAPHRSDGSFTVESNSPLATLFAEAPVTTCRLSDVVCDGSHTRIDAPRSQRIPVCPCPMWKRAMDITGSLLGLAVLWPLFLLVALLIKCVSRGPVFFRQRRYGLGGRPFNVWKFRTIEISQTPDAAPVVCGRPDGKRPADGKARSTNWRSSAAARILRQFGIDELPQLINVLKGEMSLVGPRPDVLPLEQLSPLAAASVRCFAGHHGPVASERQKSHDVFHNDAAGHRLYPASQLLARRDDSCCERFRRSLRN